jgi:DNA-binding SARP family transcriptional activator/WD40 repeat protein
MLRNLVGGGYQGMTDRILAGQNAVGFGCRRLWRWSGWTPDDAVMALLSRPPVDLDPAYSGLRVSLLGPLVVTYDGHKVAVSGVAGAVLALLSRSPGQVVSVSAMVEGLWGERPPSRPEKAVASYVSRLRHALGTGGVAEPAAVVVTRAPGYLLKVPPMAVDSVVFEAKVGQGRRALAIGQPELAARGLREAVALWRGGVLEEYAEYPFVQSEAARLDEARMSTLEALADAELAAAAPGAPPTLVAELEGLLASHPHRERLWVQLITALYRSGRQADALHAYRRARDRLVTDLGVEPGPELRDVERAVLTGAGWLLGQPITPTRLPDPLAGRESVCVGRDEELEWLAQALDRAALEGGQGRLVVAPSGYGKTQLVAQCARRAARRGVVCRYGRGTGGLDALAADESALHLVLVDDADELGSADLDRVQGWLRASARLPVLTVLTVSALPEPLAHLPRLVLTQLNAHATAEIVRLYAPVSDDQARAVTADAAGVPGRVHEAAARWAADAAVHRVGRAVARRAEPRQRLVEATDEIVAGVLDLERVRTRARLARPAPDVVLCPYKGLARFDTADADVFHGRERLVAQLVARLVDAPLVAVTGASGSGKSSLVRAGLLPALAGGALLGSAGWRPVVVTPAGDGIPGGLAADGTPVVLVIDQFEEAFTALEVDRRAAYISSLLDTVAAGHVSVVLTLRSDFYGRCAEHPGLARLVAANTVLVGPMTVDELRSAIERPADLAGLTLDDGLTDRLVDDIRDAPGGLPLLSTALLALWERRSGHRLTMAAYREIGGVHGAVEQLGERAYAALRSDAERAAARRILLRLADSADTHVVVRRRASRAEVEAVGGPAAEAALEVLAGHRLVTVSADDVQVSHEALLTGWGRLRDWLTEDADGRRLRAHLTPVAAAWAESGDAGELYRGARLAAALEWAGAHPDELTGGERAFLAASEQAAIAEELAGRRRVRRLRQLLLAAGTALVLAVVGGFAAVTQERSAERAARTADARRLGAQALVEPDIRRAALLAVAATRLDDSPQTSRGVYAMLSRAPQLLAAGGVGEGRRLLGLAVSPDGRTVATSTNDQLIQVYRADTMTLVAELPIGDLGVVDHLDFTPDGRLLLGLGEQENAEGHGLGIWDTATWRPVGGPFGPSSYLSGGNIGGGVLADNVSVVTADSDGSLGVWHLADGRLQRRLLPGGQFHPADALVPVHLGADRRTVVLDGADGARLLDAITGKVHHFPAIKGALALSPDGRRLLAAVPNGDLDVWDIPSGTRRGVARRHVMPVLDAVWSPDGTTFASTAQDRLTVVWDAKTLRPRDLLSGASGRQLNVRYSPDGTTLFADGQDGGLYAWDLTRRRSLDVELHPPGAYSGKLNTKDRGPVVFDFPRNRAIVFESDKATAVDLNTGRRIGNPLDLGHDWYSFPSLSADGRRVAVGFADGHGRVWDLQTGRLLLDVGGLSIYDGFSTNPALDQFEVDTAISPDGKTVAMGGYRLDRAGPHREPQVYSSVIHIYDVDTGAALGDPWIIEGKGHDGLAISPDGRYLAAALGDAVAVWDIIHRRQAALMRAPGQFSRVRFSADGRYLAANALDGRPSLYRTGTWKPLWRAEVGHSGPGIGLSFSPDGRTLASSGVDSKIILYDVATGDPIGLTLGPDTQAMTFLYAMFRPDRNEIVGYFGNGALHTWNLEPASWMRRACAIAGRDMTAQEWQRALPGRPYQHVCPH